MTAPAHAGWPVSKRPASPGRAEVRQEKRSVAAEHDGSSDAQPVWPRAVTPQDDGTKREEEADLAERDVHLGRQRRLG
jgi:hypothetical protein